MSVEEGTFSVRDRVDSYEDIIRQSVNILVEINASSVTTDGSEKWTANLLNHENISEGIPVADRRGGDGLPDHLVAELVAYERRFGVAQVLAESGEGTTPGSAIFEQSMQLDSTVPTFPVDDSSVPDNNDTGVTAFVTAAAADSKRQIDSWVLPALQAFNDTAAGSGGGGETGFLPQSFVNFRNEFGQGPLVDNDNHWVPSWVANVRDLQNENVRLHYGYTFYWDLYEVERRELSELIAG